MWPGSRSHPVVTIPDRETEDPDSSTDAAAKPGLRVTLKM
jgi:hypothetical protein